MDEESRILEGLRQGEAEAAGLLMDRYGSDILRTAVLLLKDRQWAEDVAQETFLLACRRIHQFRGDGSLRGWLLRTAIHLCRGRMRRAAWKRLLFNLSDEAAEHEALHPLPAVSPGSTEWVNRMTLRDEIGKLPYKYREVIVLHYFQDMRTSDIAGLLGEPEGTVKSRLKRARGQLKQHLEDGGWEHERTIQGG
ncbi:RNA polymerase sigma factor [Paenibacillus soyae]|uniref:Sigma-70 family RNA polymerase sigma factor n=1 Tax=Paenibacillus soyae TaxID=2969249 RepID=A0A9X2MR20_9BACL|nr:sigma-70 family RNA polymerase sigma factor [Paenibacillus soyae]MCR2806683.1 sigma-70 family RNA polymerase sigma factor [Paenibacillus soyae]